MTPAASAGAMTGLVTTMKSDVDGDLEGATTLAPGAYTSTHGPLLALNGTPPSLPAQQEHGKFTDYTPSVFTQDVFGHVVEWYKTARCAANVYVLPSMVRKHTRGKLVSLRGC